MNIKDLTTDQRTRIARLAKTSPGFLRHVQSGRRKPSAEMAIRIEVAAKRVGLDLPREGLCSACGGCNLARAARAHLRSCL